MLVKRWIGVVFNGLRPGFFGGVPVVGVVGENFGAP
jgi:hypothetical protein